MTIEDAIDVAKDTGDWVSDDTEFPVSCDVGFVNRDGRDDETQFDLWIDPEQELIDLWEEQCEFTMRSTLDGVSYVIVVPYVE